MGTIASILGVLNQKHILNLKRGLLLFGCTLFLYLIYHRLNHQLPPEKIVDVSLRNSTTVYKLRNQSEVFGGDVDSNSSWQMKTFFNTVVHPPGVILKTKGGIGNQLFQYACSYALAKDLGWPLYLKMNLNSFSPVHRLFQPTQRDFALDKFQIHFENIIDETTKLSAKLNSQDDGTFLKRTFLDVPNPQNQFVILGSYCQSIEYWKNYQEEIRAMYQLKKSAINFPKLKKIINKIRDSGESVVVHVRRGDFMQDGYFIPISYHRHAIRKMISTLEARGKKKPVFFVFSDDIAHAEKKLKDFAETYELVFVRREITDSTSIEDWYLMTLCKHIIIPNSTYSWWAAFLIKNVDKIVIASAQNPIYFSGAIGRGNAFFDEAYGRLYHPKEWIVIDPFTGGLAKNTVHNKDNS